MTSPRLYAVKLTSLYSASIKHRPAQRNQFSAVINRLERLPSSLHRLPEVIGVKEPGEFGINVDDVDVAFLAISNNGFIVVARLIRFHIDPE
jgi:hypothetical protein